MSEEFTPEQKRYLEGFSSGLLIARARRSSHQGESEPGKGNFSSDNAEAPAGPDAAGLEAQNRILRSGRKLSDPEKFKREQHPFDAYERLKAQAAANEPPPPADNFRWRYYGLFYLAPAQQAYMCRLRIPNGMLKHWQLAGVADLAERFGGNYTHVTTRANLQIREIEPKNAVAMIEALQDIGLCSRGAGADNIRNVTGTSTAGIDSQELIDTRPYAREWHFHILNDRGLYGLPRKFNVAFDGGGCIAALEDTNDIGFQAVEVREGCGLEPGVWFRLLLGGITGHGDFARDAGVLVKPCEATAVADAIVRVFIEHGDRTTRARARLKYVLDAWGVVKFLAAVEERLGRKLARAPSDAIAPRPPIKRLAHIGVHHQKQRGLNWIGAVLPVGRLSAEQMRGLGAISRNFGDGDVRLTVWQNLLISGVPDERLTAAVDAIDALGVATHATPLRAGLVACTGSFGCRFASADTKRHAEAIARHCEERVALDAPVNIHLTGCQNSCAQHLISDIGLLAVRVEVSDEQTIDGYHVYLGGAFGAGADIGKELRKDVPAEVVPALVERILAVYLDRSLSREEDFLAFVQRTGIEELRGLIELMEQAA